MLVLNVKTAQNELIIAYFHTGIISCHMRKETEVLFLVGFILGAPFALILFEVEVIWPGPRS